MRELEILISLCLLASAQSQELTWRQVVNLYKPGLYQTRNTPRYKGYDPARIWDSSPGGRKSSRIEVTGECYTWGVNHYKTFDGKVFSFAGNCQYVLAADTSLSYRIYTPTTQEGCDKSLEPICTEIAFEIDSDTYLLRLDKYLQPILTKNYEMHRFPINLPGLKGTMNTDHVTLIMTEKGVQFEWDYLDVLKVRVNQTHWGRTTGLCGNFDGVMRNDLKSNSSKVMDHINNFKAEDKCIDDVKTKPDCKGEDRLELCNRLFQEIKFEPCRKVSTVVEYYRACEWDVCAPKQLKKDKELGCKTIEFFVEGCKSQGIGVPNWRHASLCPLECTNGKVYLTCGSTQTCSGLNSTSSTCREGCYCPSGMYLYKDKCVTRAQCPCYLNGKDFPPGSVVNKECSSCKCTNGDWTCKEKDCSGRCIASGDPHYTTFDQTRFDFMGRCLYYLVITDQFTIKGENVACNGGDMENQIIPPATAALLPACTKSVIVSINGTDIHMKQKRHVTVDDEPARVPFTIKGVTVRDVSSNFIQALLPGGMEVNWDGLTVVYVRAPSHFKGKTKGLCGNFNGNQTDEFMTPEGDIVKDLTTFGNSWLAADCDSQLQLTHHPCYENRGNRATAEKLCSYLRSKLFDACQHIVPPESYYNDCIYDMCACQGNISLCLCPMIADYAQECAHQGVQVAWRHAVSECSVQCPPGQTYQTCGDSCLRTCSDLSETRVCSKYCVEGCRCPEGTLLNIDNQCVHPDQCPCYFNGKEFPNGYKELRKDKGANELCICQSGRFACEKPSPEVLNQAMCDHDNNSVYTDCLPAPQQTCDNLAEIEDDQVAQTFCKSGCACKTDFVWHPKTQKCVKPEDCGCYENGKVYREGDQVQIGCKNCTCSDNKWKCNKGRCPGYCKTWSSTHFKTFDGKLYDFRGNCEYVFSEGEIDDKNKFRVTLELSQCGASVCKKSLVLTVWKEGEQEKFMIFDNIEDRTNIKPNTIQFREVGDFTFAEVSHLDIAVQWDKRSTIIFKAGPKWKSKVSGLCGNFNKNMSDDLVSINKEPLAKSKSYLYAEQWKTNRLCSSPATVENACQNTPEGQFWSMEKCSILKSHHFEPCHKAIPVDPYVSRCLIDSCERFISTKGGDFDDLCTAISVYAQECATAGIPIKWRSQKLCPFHCDSNHYSPCISTCPLVTCNTNGANVSSSCIYESCVEGCEPPLCNGDEVYNNIKDLKCIPKSRCHREKCAKRENELDYEQDPTCIAGEPDPNVEHDIFNEDLGAPPPDSCIYEMKHTSDDAVGERPLRLKERYKIIKKAGEVWNDGPCIKCECHSKFHQVVCLSNMCSLVPPENRNYVLEPKFTKDKCCPTFKRRQCKHEGKIYNSGEKWNITGSDYCAKYFSCFEDENGEVNLLESREKCSTECPMGWEYRPPTKFSEKCCGECRPVACYVTGVLRPNKSKWITPDNCTTYECRIQDNLVQVLSYGPECPDITNCPPNKIFRDKCCRRCDVNDDGIRDQRSCMAESIPLDKTLGLLVVSDPQHGYCTNYDYIRGLKQCIGVCDSSVLFDKESLSFNKTCNCCQEIGLRSVTVNLDCDDSYTIKKMLLVPTECACLGCGNP